MPSVYGELLAVIAPVAICAGVGFCWARTRQPFEHEFVSRLVMNVGAPCLIVGTLSEIEVAPALLGQMALAVLVLLAITVAAAAALCAALRLPLRTYLTPLVFPNTGNMGLPLALFAFGEQGLAIALTVFMLVSIAHFSLGVAFMQGGSPFAGMARSPTVYAGLIATALIVGGWQLPGWLTNTLGLLGDVSIPLMLITLGVSLAGLRVHQLGSSLGLGAARIAIGFGAAWLTSELLGLQGVARGVLLIQSAMPMAVFSYLLASRYQRGADAVAGMVVMSTLLAFALLPLLLWVARG